MQLLLFGVQTLLRVVVSCLGRPHLRAIVGERKHGVRHLHANLSIKLLEPQLGLTVLHQRTLLLGLRFAVANGDGQVEADTLVRGGAVDEVGEHSSVTAGRGVACDGARDAREVTVLIDGTADDAGAVEPVDIERGQQGVACTFQRNLVVAQGEHGLFQLRPTLECLLHERLHGLTFF